MSAKRLLNIAKKVIRGAVGIGIEEAGVRICGPTGWKFVGKALAPVLNELERRFPDFMLVPEKLDEAERALDEDGNFEALVSTELTALKEGHVEILKVLARQDEVMQENSAIIIRALEEARQQGKAAHEQILAEFAKTSARDHQILAEIRSLHEVRIDPAIAGLSSRDLYYKANTYQHDAMKWISQKDYQTAAERVASGRALAEVGLRREPDSARFAVTIGFLEKTEAQIATMHGDVDAAMAHLGHALIHFRRAGQLDPANLDALNGMANVYAFQGDYQRAIDLGMSVIETRSDHGPAALDLSLALEHRIRELGPASPAAQAYTEFLITLYRHLEDLMPRQPGLFPASYLHHVQRRRAALEAARPAGSG